MFKLVSFLGFWFFCSAFCEYNDVARHFCDEVFWAMRKRGNK